LQKRIRNHQQRNRRLSGTRCVLSSISYRLRIPGNIYIPYLSELTIYLLKDIHHYTGAQYAYQPLEVFQNRDEMKRTLAQQQGINLFIIPCWWDGKPDRYRLKTPFYLCLFNFANSLVETIRLRRPDLVAHVETSGMPIPTAIPPYITKQTKEIADIGEAVTACFFVNSAINPTDWYVRFF